MRTFFDLSTPAKRFRLIAVTEAFTWLGLLVSMYFKYFTGNPYTNAAGTEVYPNEIGVQIFGSLHGAAFILFLIAAVLAARALKWSWKTTVLAVIAAFPPFFTLLFEVWAIRTGRLGELSRPSAQGAADAAVALGEA